MGAKQSKRSVDISGKEGDAAGEVAAAGAGGEGRVEQLADADALKPQLNGDAHIHEPTDKEKELDSGTPENEKDATTEKENKEQEEEKEKEASPVTNGDGEQKPENGDSAPTPEDAKKPKKEKVKKKWSLRSISFSRKDKPKQEKKQKEEEPKTNGEPEKVPEETGESSPEPVVTEEKEEVKTPVDAKDEKAPETPVTEPITNGSSTPESPKLEIPAVEESVAVTPEEDKVETKSEPEPELPVSGLSLEETKQDIPEIENKIEEMIGSKSEETPVETTEVVPVPEIPVKKEVCVEQVPLIEPTPPPLPANPPPSSVASFAATTMAPELTDASLSNTTEIAVPAQTSATDSNTSFSDNPSDPQTNLTNVTAITDVLTLRSNENEGDKFIGNPEIENESKIILATPNKTNELDKEILVKEENLPGEILNEATKVKIENKIEEHHIDSERMDIAENSMIPSEGNTDVLVEESEATNVEATITESLETNVETITESCQNESVDKKDVDDSTEISSTGCENETKEMESSTVVDPSTKESEDVGTVEMLESIVDEQNKDFQNNENNSLTIETNTNVEPPVVAEIVEVEEFPPPPPVVHAEVDKRDEAMDEGNDIDVQEPVNSSNQDDAKNTVASIIPDATDTESIKSAEKIVVEDNITFCKDPLGNVITNLECNGNVDDEDKTQETISMTTEANKAPLGDSVVTSDVEPEKEAASEGEWQASRCSGHGDAQDSLPEKLSDKMDELISDVTPVPECKSEMETSSDVAVAN